MKKKIHLFLVLILMITTLFSCSTSDEQVDQTMTYHLDEEELSEVVSNSKVGVLAGGSDELCMSELYPDAKTYPFSTNSDILAAVGASKVQYGISSEAQAILYIKANDYRYEYCDTPLFTFNNAFALNKDNTELTKQISECIQQMKEDGTLDSLYQKWVIDGDYSTDDIPRLEGDDIPVLEAAVDCTGEPLAFIYNGEKTGYDCEVLERVAYQLGMRVEFQDMTFGALISSVVSGKSDVAVGITPTEERAKQIDFTETYYEEKCVIVSKKEDSNHVSIIDSLKNSFIGTFITENRWELFVSGIGITLLISIGSFVLGTICGILICWMLMAKKKWISKLGSLYVTISTGIPVLVWLMILYYIVFKQIDISGIIVAIITFGLQTGASLSGVFQTGVESIDKGQIEAAQALGFSSFGVFKNVIFPQVTRNIFGLYEGEFVGLVKTTSIVGYIAITDLTKVSDIVRSRTYQAFFPLIITAIIYFVLTHVLIIVLKKIQRKINHRNILLKGVKQDEC